MVPVARPICSGGPIQRKSHGARPRSSVTPRIRQRLQGDAVRGFLCKRIHGRQRQTPARLTFRFGAGRANNEPSRCTQWTNAVQAASARMLYRPPFSEQRTTRDHRPGLGRRRRASRVLSVPINTRVVRSWSGYKRTMDGLSVSRLDCTPERASELSAIPSAHL